MNMPMLDAMLMLFDRHRCFEVGHPRAESDAMTRNVRRKEMGTALTETNNLSKQDLATKHVVDSIR